MDDLLLWLVAGMFAGLLIYIYVVADDEMPDYTP